MPPSLPETDTTSVSTLTANAIAGAVRARKISAALAAISVSLLLVALGLWFESAVNKDLGVPDSVDVLVCGNSTVAVPLANYQFPEGSFHAKIEAQPIYECTKFENALEQQCGVRHSVWNASIVGETLKETAVTVRSCLEKNKRPRVLALFITPVTLLQHSPHQPAVPANEDWVRLRKQLHCPLLSRVAHWRPVMQGKLDLAMSTLYAALGFFEPHERHWKRVEERYALDYLGTIGGEKLTLLQRLVCECQEHGTRVLVVSMPLFRSNRELMKLWSYSDYSATLKAAIGSRCSLIDLGNSPLFRKKRDFHDGAHCNGTGMKKVIGIIAPELARLLETPTIARCR